MGGEAWGLRSKPRCYNYGDRMPPPVFFRKLGCFVRGDFLSQEECADICVEVRAAAQVKDVVVGSRQTGEGAGVVDETIKKVLRAKVAGTVEARVESRLEELKPELERHFHVTLTGRQGPLFMRYPPEAFYVPHHDAVPGSPPDIASRRVSVVIFLNHASRQPGPDCYGGGALRLYGLLNPTDHLS